MCAYFDQFFTEQERVLLERLAQKLKKSTSPVRAQFILDRSYGMELLEIASS